MNFKFLYSLCVQEMIYICNTTKAQSSFSSEKTERPPKVQNCSHKLTTTYNNNQQGKMIPYFLVLILIHHISNISTMDIDLSDVDLPNNVLKFGYSINYKYMGKVSHSLIDFI